jgi:predicted phosphodiesterase
MDTWIQKFSIILKIGMNYGMQVISAVPPSLMHWKNSSLSKAVYGNIDDKTLQTRYPEDLFFKCEEVDIWMTHIGGVPPGYNPRIKKMLKGNVPNIFICGHSHILRIKRDLNFNNMLYLNPGAAGNQGFHSMKTIVRFDIHDHKIENMDVIELGKRGALKSMTQLNGCTSVHRRAPGTAFLKNHFRSRNRQKLPAARDWH